MRTMMVGVLIALGSASPAPAQVAANEFFVGCATKSMAEELRDLYVSGDKEAAHRFLFGHVLSRQCRPFEKGELYYVRQTDSGFCYRAAGETACFYRLRD